VLLHSAMPVMLSGPEDYAPEQNLFNTDCERQPPYFLLSFVVFAPELAGPSILIIKGYPQHSSYVRLHCRHSAKGSGSSVRPLIEALLLSLP